MEEINAKIEYATLGYEGHHILTIMLGFTFGSGGQGYGGYSMEGASGFLSESIKGILDTVGEEDWNKLKGSLVRLRRQGGWNGKIVAVGNIMEDKWFSFEDIKKKLNLA